MKRILWISTMLLMVGIVSVNAQHLHKAIPDGRVDSVRNGIDLPEGYTGAGVIIGVTDWGFDYTHPVFYDSLMNNYRILRAWDQFKNAGPAPEGYNYGTEYVGKEALLEAHCDTNNIYGHHYHGTHVASIAGGAGAGTKYMGVAPEAEFLFGTFLVDEQAVIDMWNWMFNVAQSEGKRLVINMSWGLHYMDNLTGNGRLAQAMQSLSDQGVVFVTSAGNNGDVNFHIEHNFQQDTIHSEITFRDGAAHYWGQSISMTSSENESFAFSFTICNNNYATLAESPMYHTLQGSGYIDTFLVVNNSDTVFYNVETDQQNIHNQRPEVRFRVQYKNNYRFVLNVTAPSGDFHAWNLAELTTGVGNWGADFVRPEAFPSWIAGDKYYGIGAPSSFDCTISVAAHVSQSVNSNGNTVGGYIADFSSYGITIDGRQKPDISAPGREVISAKNSYTDQSVMGLSPIEFEGRTYQFCKASGTSMSSPFVAGVAALLLQANPTLTAEQVKDILLRTARQDNFTASSGSILFGAGKVDAYHAIREALGISGLAEIHSFLNQYSVYPNPAQDVIYISTINSEDNTMVTLYDINGKMLRREHIKQGVNCINTTNYKSGLYILKISNSKKELVKKVVITR